MTDLLYRWPSAARFGRQVPKTKFYEHGTVSTAVRERFIADVQRVTWAYKLAESTINLPGSAAVPEIQVFQVDAKDGDVAESVLTAIDKAVRTPVIFENTRADGCIRMTGANKQSTLGAYYTTGWLPADTERQPLPTVIALSALYTALLEPLTPVSARPGEDVADLAARLEAVRRLEREVAALERRLRNEPQLNRKVELRRALRTKQAELEQQR